MSAFAEGRSNGQKYAQGGGDHTVTDILCDKIMITSLVQSLAKLSLPGFVHSVSFCCLPLLPQI